VQDHGKLAGHGDLVAAISKFVPPGISDDVQGLTCHSQLKNGRLCRRAQRSMAKAQFAVLFGEL
jgi:hypothetical protein